jgi:hypothetical protein
MMIEDRDHEGEQHRDQQLLGGLDRAGVGFFLRVAHGVLKNARRLVKTTGDYSQRPRAGPAGRASCRAQAATRPV